MPTSLSCGAEQPAPQPGNGAGPISIERLRGSSNYVSWKFSMRMLLILENIWNCVESTSQSATTDTQRDQRALARICLSVEPALYQYVRDAKTASEAWNNLAKVFEDRGLYRRVLLLRQLHHIEYKNYSNMQEYINTVMTLVSQLADIGRSIEDGEVAEILLSGLPSEYDVLVSNLETACISTTSLSSELVRTRLLQEEMRKNGNEHTSSTDNAYFAKKKVICSFCGKSGHVRNRCFKLKKQKKDKAEREKTEKATIATDCAYSVTQTDFIVDSGCSSHMINNKNMFHNFNNKKSHVCIANNTYLDSEGSGKFIIPCSNIEIEAMLVPKLANQFTFR
ncbi:Copia protein [Papilio machaon]|uniref:Copia protein n=1 Tax=Papilio machaon TaxID=76193 RepID=A0A0N1I711_PAPMA|nr:Copia protein [Papilio machaon]